MTNITEHFTLEEMTRTGTGLPNVPSDRDKHNLVRLCTLLEDVRELSGPLKVNSGFRCNRVNTAVGGVWNSAHMFGRAADVVPVHGNISDLFDLVKKSDLSWDQLILEPGWVHIGIEDDGKAPRRECLVARSMGGKMSYEPCPR